MVASIEYGHIYVDQEAGPEQTISERRARDIAIPGDQLVIMVDDYHPETCSLDVEGYIEAMEPDAWVREADLEVYVYELLHRPATPKDEKRSALRYHDLKGRWSCSALTAVWYALRLGVLEDDLHVVQGRLVAAERLLNVLSRIYMQQEARTLRLVPDLEDMIDYNVYRVPHPNREVARGA